MTGSTFQAIKLLTLLKSIMLALLCLNSASHAAAAGDKPNIVLIMADDIGFECYSGYGSPFYSTPNIDRLAETGAKFTQAYAQPLCTPSRVKIMTGRFNFRNYTEFGRLDLSQPTFAKMVKANGYATCIAGKWQLSAGDLNGPFKAGFDEYCLWHFGARNENRNATIKELRSKGSRYKSPTLFRNGELVEGTEGKYGPDLVTDHIIDFIERKKESPFLVYYPMILVHNPFVATPDSPSWNSRNKQDAGRKARDHFRDMVAYMDKTIGRIVTKLDELGLRENTLIMITGDNGTNKSITSPFPGRGQIKGGKGMTTDAGTRVAFVANWPGHIQPGTVIDSPIDFAGVLPTIAEVTGSNIPVGTDGQSFLPLLRGDSSKARDWIFVSYSRNGLKSAPFKCFVRDRRWKLYADGSLYDVPNDWLEQSRMEGAQADRVRKRLQPLLDEILKDAPKAHIQFDAG
ncbi:MAG: sulfatase-like hydrolase/transferase [Planctomycetes bacterium]|nr:sulfatase-like hydrolase/transferase [Planctomycetota bacterium]